MYKPIRDLKSTVVSKLPNCDFCKRENIEEPAEYDGKTVYGPWANMCQKHFEKYGSGLGLGVGQMLTLPLKPDCEHRWENDTWDMDGKTVKCLDCGEDRRVELDSDMGGRLPFI